MSARRAPIRGAAGWFARRTVATVLAVCSAVACTPSSPARPAHAVSEFLLISDDSTAWVRDDADSTRVQRAPMLLATLDGRVVEIYVAEEPLDFDEATFLVSRVYTRDLASGDSTLVFADSTVLRTAMAWVRNHPDATRLDDDDEPPDDVPSCDASITPLDVIGTTLGLEVHLDRMTGELGTHDTYRATVDLTSGRRLALRDIVSADRARISLDGAAAALRDAARAAGAQGGDLGRAAGAALSGLTIDPLSFVLAQSADSLAAQFLAHTEQVIDESRDSHRFAVDAVTIGAPAWWTAARATLPQVTPDSVAHVRTDRLALDLTYDQHEVAQVTTGTGSARRTVLRMRGPIRRVIALDDAVTRPSGRWRAALERAFAEAGYYSDEVRAVSLRRRARPVPPSRRGARLPAVTQAASL